MLPFNGNQPYFTFIESRHAKQQKKMYVVDSLFSSYNPQILIQFSNYLILVFFQQNVSVSTQLLYGLEKKAATGICISLFSVNHATPFRGTGCSLSGVELCFLLLSSCKRHSQHRSS